MRTTGGTTGASGGKASCEGYEDTPFRDEVTVRYENAGEQPIYIGRTYFGCGPNESFLQLFDATQNELFWQGDRCMTCENLRLGPPRCPTNCPIPELVKVEPGGSYDSSWNGTYFERVSMPQACNASGVQTNTCNKLMQAEPAPYTFLGTVWSDFECREGANCPCTAVGEGACLLAGDSVATGTRRAVTQVLGYPMQKLVTLRFE
jgi:hypothetical protein